MVRRALTPQRHRGGFLVGLQKRLPLLGPVVLESADPPLRMVEVGHRVGLDLGHGGLPLAQKPTQDRVDQARGLTGLRLAASTVWSTKVCSEYSVPQASARADNSRPSTQGAGFLGTRMARRA